MTDGWLDRLREEREDLEAKLRRLEATCFNPSFKNLTAHAQRLMTEQRYAMAQYSRVLAERIALLTPEPPKAA